MRNVPPPPEDTPPALAEWLLAVTHAFHDYYHRYRRQALIGYLILVAGVVVAFAQNHSESNARRVQGVSARHAVVQSGRAVAVEGCNRDFESTKSLRGVLVASQAASAQSFKRGEITKQRYEQSQAFFKTQLEKLPLPDCRKVLRVVTDDPNKTTRIPVPSHP
jgi:hypothetical protein